MIIGGRHVYGTEIEDAIANDPLSYSIFNPDPNRSI